MMRLKKGGILILLALCIVLGFGCTKAEKEKALDAGTREGEEEKGPEIVSFEDGDGSKEEVPAFIIKKEDADNLMTEALAGSGCSAEYRDSIEIDEGGYYTYTVKDPEGNTMDMILAVDGFSGEVKVYDPLKKGVLDFSEFHYYEKTDSRFRDISWDGKFSKGDLSIELLPADDSSFEFTVYEKDKAILSGLALIEKDGASWESEDKKDSIGFKMTGAGVLQVTGKGDHDISGEYKRK